MNPQRGLLHFLLCTRLRRYEPRTGRRFVAGGVSPRNFTLFVAKPRRGDRPSADNRDTYYLRDAMGGHVGLLTDDDGDLSTPQRFSSTTYDAFGNAMSASRPPPGAGSFAWRGAEGSVYDAHPTLVYMQARHYDPTIGRFIQPDALALASLTTQGMNRYIYCENDPVNRTDPLGLFGIWDSLAVLGAGIAILSGAALILAGPASVFAGIGLIAAGAYILLSLAASLTNDMKLRCSLLQAAAYARWIGALVVAVQLGLVFGGIGLAYGLQGALAAIVPKFAAIGSFGVAIGGLGLAGPFWDE